VKVVDLPLSDKQTVAQVKLEAHVVRHRSSEDLWVHLRDLERILLPPMGRVHRENPSSHGVESSSSSSVSAKQHLPLPQHKSHEGQDRHACQSPPTH
jgi:uncharacterized alpha-E superfamily protein